MKGVLLVFFTTLVVFVSVSYSQTPPPTPVWPLQWHADVIVGDAGLTPNAVSLSVLYQGSYFYNYSSAPVATYYLTHRYSSRIVKEVLFSDGGDSVTPYVVDYSSGTCSSPILVKDRWQIFTPNLIARKGFKFIAYDYLLSNEGDSYIETTHWRYNTILGTAVEYWHATGTNSPFRLSWSPITGNPVIVQFSNFVSSFADIPNPDFYFNVPSSCSSSTLESQVENHHHAAGKPNKQAAFDSLSLSYVQKRAAANPWPQQWNAAARFTGNVFGQQNLSVATIPFELSGHFYYDYIGLRECNVWTDLSTGARSKTLIVNGTFHVVTLSTGFCLTIPIAPVSGPLKPEWPVAVPSVGTQWLYVKNTKAFIETGHYRIDALNAGEKNAFNYWQSSNGTPRLFQGPVLDKAPYGVSLMEWEGVEMGLQGVDVNDVFSVPAVCHAVPLEKLSQDLHWVSALVKSHQVSASYFRQ